MNLIQRVRRKYQEEGASSTFQAALKAIRSKCRLSIYQATRPKWLKELAAREYHRHYVYDELHHTLEWNSHSLIKYPTDLIVYQEIIQEIHPDIIVECGTYKGGSALFFADICELVGNGNVITVDVDSYDSRPEHDRITYVTGSSVAADTVDAIKQQISDSDTVLVILDSNHNKPHVRKELEIYSEIVTPGSYLIVEDTDINGHPVKPWWGPGPMEAVEDFLSQTDSFAVDKHRERFSVTFAPNGFLRKVE